jgi:hypothetical protein
MSDINELIVGSSPVLQLTLTNPLINPPEVSDASVAVTLYNPENEEVDGQTWPVTLPYSGAGGIYRETLAPISGIEAGVIYHAKYVATGADGIVGNFCLTIKAKGC